MANSDEENFTVDNIIPRDDIHTKIAHFHSLVDSSGEGLSIQVSDIISSPTLIAQRTIPNRPITTIPRVMTFLPTCAAADVAIDFE